MRISVFIFLVFLISACTIETAKPISGQKLIVVSDYLAEKDTSLFTSFCKKNNIRIEIQALSRKEIETIHQQEGFNTNIDIVMLHNIYDTYKLYKQKLIQPIYEKSSGFSDTILMNASKGIIGIGYDPFIFSYNADSLGLISSAGEMTVTPFQNALSEKEQLVFLSGFRKEYDSPETMQLAIGMDTNNIEIDSLTSWQAVYLETKSDESDQFAHSFIDINGKSMYDVRSVACYRQSSKFELAKKFMLYLRNPKTNIRINKKWKTIPIDFDLIDSDHAFNPISKKIDDFFQYYKTIERIQEKIKNGKS